MNSLSPISVPCEDLLHYQDQEPIQKIFVGGLSSATSSKMMEDYFNNRYRGVYMKDIVVLSDVMRDKNKQSRCFGFIEFNADIDTQMLVDHLPHIIDGKTVECKLAVPKNKKDSEKKKKRKKSDMMEPKMLNISPLINLQTNCLSPLTAPEYQTPAYRHLIEDCYQTLQIQDIPTLEDFKEQSPSNIERFSDIDSIGVHHSSQDGSESSDSKSPGMPLKRILLNRVDSQIQAKKQVQNLKSQIAKQQFEKVLEPGKNNFLNPQNQIEMADTSSMFNRLIPTFAPQAQNEQYDLSIEGIDLSDPQYKKIFVGGLPHNMALDDFKQYFSKYGELDDCVILKDKRTQKPRGFGFVTYRDISSVHAVMSTKERHIIQDKWVDCKSAIPIKEMKDLQAGQEIPLNDGIQNLDLDSSPTFAAVSDQQQIDQTYVNANVTAPPPPANNVDKVPDLQSSHYQNDMNHRIHPSMHSNQMPPSQYYHSQQSQMPPHQFYQHQPPSCPQEQFYHHPASYHNPYYQQPVYPPHPYHGGYYAPPQFQHQQAPMLAYPPQQYMMKPVHHQAGPFHQFYPPHHVPMNHHQVSNHNQFLKDQYEMQYHKDLHDWHHTSIHDQMERQAQKNCNDKYIKSLNREYGETEKAQAYQNDPYSIFQSINAQYGQTIKVPTMEANEFVNRQNSDSSDASIPEEFKHFTSDIGKEEDYKEFIASDHQLEPTVNMRQHPKNGEDTQAYRRDFDRSIYTQQSVKEDYYQLQNDLDRQEVDWSGLHNPTKMYFQGFMSSTNDQIVHQMNCNELENKHKVQEHAIPKALEPINTNVDIDSTSKNESTATQRSPISD